MVLSVKDRYSDNVWSVTNVYVDARFTNIEISNIREVMTIEYSRFYDWFEVPENVSRYIAKKAFEQLGGRI